MAASISFGRYTLRRELGRGAMGVVYEAHDPARGVDLALKVMSVPARGSPEARRRQEERFLREARALAALSHPGVVSFFDQGEIGGRHYFSMELVRGTTLRDRIQFQGPLSVPELIRLGVDLCETLQHVHSHGVVHRDVKPENIMLLTGGASKLMDFGIAQITADHNSAPPGGWQGSPAYMSPEQVEGLLLDGRSDLYSLAVTLYEAATGRRAVPGDTIPVITHRIRHEYPPPPTGLPPYLQCILMRALAKNPAHRYDTAREMGEDLRLGRTPRLASDGIRVGPAPSDRPDEPPPVFLGSPEPLGATLMPLAAPAASLMENTPTPSVPGAPWNPGFLLDSAPVVEPHPLGPVAPGETVALPAEPLVASTSAAMCPQHAGAVAVLQCVRCRVRVCYACHMELPGRGTHCRRCASGG